MQGVWGLSRHPANSTGAAEIAPLRPAEAGPRAAHRPAKLIGAGLATVEHPHRQFSQRPCAPPQANVGSIG